MNEDQKFATVYAEILTLVPKVWLQRENQRNPFEGWHPDRFIAEGGLHAAETVLLYIKAAIKEKR